MSKPKLKVSLDYSNSKVDTMVDKLAVLGQAIQLQAISAVAVALADSGVDINKINAAVFKAQEYLRNIKRSHA